MSLVYNHQKWHYKSNRYYITKTGIGIQGLFEWQGKPSFYYITMTVTGIGNQSFSEWHGKANQVDSCYITTTK